MGRGVTAREAAVLAGAQAWHARIQSQRMDAGRKAPDGGPWRWGHLVESDRRAYLALARPVVEAALDAYDR